MEEIDDIESENESENESDNNSEDEENIFYTIESLEYKHYKNDKDERFFFIIKDLPDPVGDRSKRLLSFITLYTAST